MSQPLGTRNLSNGKAFFTGQCSSCSSPSGWGSSRWNDASERVCEGIALPVLAFPHPVSPWVQIRKETPDPAADCHPSLPLDMTRIATPSRPRSFSPPTAKGEGQGNKETQTHAMQDLPMLQAGAPWFVPLSGRQNYPDRNPRATQPRIDGLVTAREDAPPAPL